MIWLRQPLQIYQRGRGWCILFHRKPIWIRVKTSSSSKWKMMVAKKAHAQLAWAAIECKSAAAGHIVFMSTWFSLSYKKCDSSHHALEDFFWKLMFATWKGKQVIISLSNFFTVCIYFDVYVLAKPYRTASVHYG